jgi:predicted O-methyltransferase YrrM
MAFASPKSKIDTIEKSRENIREAKKYAEEFGVLNQINFIEGAFLDIVPNLKEEYDLIFFDGFAPHLEMLINLEDLLKGGGVMIYANLNIGVQSKACLQRFQEREIYSTSFQFDDTAIGIKA